ncbi:integrase [Periweissella cryptocerci]|uniref:Integrase n=1 Tax=Periweissella cryptocerci TaxID=2506420 RepID=A0A4P6YR71_9LACO|nr:tyrosine-type recombinase/integrase [Periweissella cryptocerci]QBO35128.1 integrase [Periweissella cryptocerci]
MLYNVQPLRTVDEIAAFQAELRKGKYGKRNEFLFLLGINTGLRMGDLLNIKVGDVTNCETVSITEQKTKKARTLYLGEMRAMIQAYVKNLGNNQYLFQSRTGQQLTVDAVYKIFQKASDNIGRQDIGTHTLRKTFGYHYYQRTHDIATLMMILNHSSEAITKRYIGITDTEIKQSLKGFKLGF